VPLRVLVILGHPRRDSLCGALAEAYAEGARTAGTRVEVLHLGEMAFDINYPIGREDAPEESDLEHARALVSWADHLVFVFPNWWGTMPALLKGFIDRIFKPGYAFCMHPDGSWDQLLQGKSAHLINTMDTPGWVYRWIYASPGIKAMKMATLQFCGIRPVRVTSFGTVFDSTPARRAAWLTRARFEGLRLAAGVPDAREHARAKILGWLRAIRLQFYPMTWLAYALGAMAAGGGKAVLGDGLFWLGYAAIFLLEFATVLANEHYDYRTDQANRNFGPFNGGSRVLVDGTLNFREVRAGIALGIAGFLCCAVWLAGLVPGLLPLLTIALVLCLGYTVPPLKLSHRGLGELDVAVTHSFLVLLFGYLLYGGSHADGFPWIAGIPLFLAIVPAIALSGLPDRQADLAAGKRTFAVRAGPAGTIRLAMALSALAAGAAVTWDMAGFADGVYDGASWFVVPHAVLLLHLLRRLAGDPGRHGGRIDRLMITALTYIGWFALIPFINGS
jgi:putative NADPH-quinone reductase/1,4-dihydroxy-2-naphthoate octaprenyltransferase